MHFHYARLITLKMWYFISNCWFLFQNHTFAYSFWLILFPKLMYILLYTLIWLQILLATLFHTITKPDRIHFNNLRFFWFLFQISSSDSLVILLKKQEVFINYISFLIFSRICELQVRVYEWDDEIYLKNFALRRVSELSFI